MTESLNPGRRAPAPGRAAAARPDDPQEEHTVTETESPTPTAPTLEEARTRAAVLTAATPANPNTPTGRAAHGVLAALLYAAALDGDGLTRVMQWVATDDREEPTQILAARREDVDACAAAAALILSQYADPAYQATVTRLVRAALITTAKES
ncbi:hypothetical protein [Nocardiopsis deserti]|uniref:hypothetical protein n=1 Tax=Nocardiopsis deserti TaxID=2605988 RepID=UPI00123C63F8|nr:hypothetical protein [Nocardiopsis deserti]